MDKLCKDCKHYKREWFFFWRRDYDRCTRRGKLMSFIDGKLRSCIMPFAYLEREFDIKFTCGPEGKYWEAKSES